MRQPLSTLEIFNAIASEGTLRGAAASLGIRPSTVSHQLKTLENQLGVSLFSRTTRSIALTEAGKALYRGTQPAFSQLSAAIQSAKDAGNSQQGALRITMPGFAYDMIIANMLASFRKAYPDVELEININETFVNLFEEGFHAGIRLGDRIDPDMVAIRISPPLELAVLASEQYLQEYGCPTNPEELVEHECIQYRFGQSGLLAPWEFNGPQGRYSVKVSGGLIVNTLPTLFSAVADGLGLGYSFVDQRVTGSEPKIVPILQDHIEPISGVFLYYPKEYRSQQLLRLFIDHIR